MKKLLFGITLLLLVFCLHSQQPGTNSTAAQAKTAVVSTTAGKLRGLTEGDVDIFMGIPYAAAPVGEFRWRPPQSFHGWQGERDATKFGANCAQSGWGGAPGSIQKGSSEDCLFLNIWRPAWAKPAAKLPVMVWIHGGAFVGGSGADSGAGNQFAKQGVMLVTINYRLGRLGHFAFPALSKEYPEEPKGSYAFMDQIAALKWVKQNIAAFGGDPDGKKEFAEVQTRFNTDKVWAEPARFVASTFAGKGDPSYIFLFSYVPSAMKDRMKFGPGHGTDISYAFDNLGRGNFGPPPPPPTAVDKEVARMMNSYWVNFAKTGNPNGNGLPKWPAYNTKKNEILDIQPDGKPVGKPDPRKARLDVIEKAVNKGDKLQPNGI